MMVLRRAAHGIYVTTAGFSRPALELAHDAKVIAIDGDGLVGLMGADGDLDEDDDPSDSVRFYQAR